MEKTAWQGNIVKVTTEEINGIVWERVYLPNGVVVFPITDDGKILMIRERRPHENPPVRLKPVSGILEEGQSAEENALREMQEEIGLAGKMELLWSQRASGTINTTTHYFIARDLYASKIPNPDGEEIIEEVKAFTPQELQQLLETSDYRWSHSTLGIIKLLSRLKE